MFNDVLIHLCTTVALYDVDNTQAQKQKQAARKEMLASIKKVKHVFFCIFLAAVMLF